MPLVPPTRYARSGDARIAYQVLGGGPPDVVFIGGPASHLDLQWDDPNLARTMQRYASFCRLIRFDRRGTGLSDAADRALTLELQADDLEAVIDAVGSARIALIAAGDAGAGAMYAASRPDRVSALVLVNVTVAGGVVPDSEQREMMLELVENHWGEGRFVSLFAPSRADDPSFVEWWTRFERACVSPSTARKLIELNFSADLSGVLPAIRVPTLVLQQRDNPLASLQAGIEAAALIPGARFVEAPGSDSYDWPSSDDPEMDLIEEFLTGRRSQRTPERVLATVMFTDIVGSTDRAAEVGDRAWRKLLDRHNELIEERIDRYRGRVIKTVGDGFLVTFDGPARAVRCAQEIVECVKPLDLSVRCGLHTGECELIDDDVGGIAVHIGARVCATARGDEVLASSTVKDLVVGSELGFEDRGPHQLRGVPGEWRLFALARDGT
ncbi:MAG TPA: adenylate/guanylate cyclase domain-containing protein [Solirubrobacteraceae bacterium]